jgi:Family of unknown function (DUF5309)
MAVPANTYTTYGTRGNREDLSQMIYMMSPTATPFYSTIPDDDTKSRVPRWQTDALASATTTNRHLEGDDTAADASIAPLEFANPCQIFKKSPRVSRTQQIVDAAGRGNEMGYQVEKRTLELKRDMEATLLSNNPGANTTTDSTTGKDASGGTTAAGGRQLAGLIPWARTIVINDSDVGGGAGLTTTPVTINPDIGFPTAQLDITGTADADHEGLSEESFISLIQQLYDKGAAVDFVLVPTGLKSKFSDMRGYNQREIPATDKEIVQTFDIYHTDFGAVEIVPDIFMQQWITDDAVLSAGEKTRTLNSYALAIEAQKVACCYLDDFRIVALSKTGDSDVKQITAELTLKVRNPEAIGILVGINAAELTVAKV